MHGADDGMDTRGLMQDVPGRTPIFDLKRAEGGAWCQGLPLPIAQLAPTSRERSCTQDAVVKGRRGADRSWWDWWRWSTAAGGCWRSDAGGCTTTRRQRQQQRTGSSSTHGRSRRREQQPQCDSIACSRWCGSNSVRNDTSCCLCHIASRQHSSIHLELELPGGLQALERQGRPQLPRPGQAPVPEAATDLQQLLGYVGAVLACAELCVCAYRSC